MAKTRLDEALDKLFGVPVEEFMQTREALAGELRAAGEKEAAATVKAQHKPTLAAHALNHLARVAPSELGTLFAASRQLASGEDFKTALDHQRTALEKVRAKVTGADAIDVVNVLRGAMVDEALAERVLAGHFSKLPETQVGFFGAAPLGGPPKAEAPAAKKQSAKPTTKEAPLPDIDRGELGRARAAREAKETTAREKAEREQTERIARIARELKEAEAELATLKAAAADAERKADQARRQLKVAADRVDAIRARQQTAAE